MSAKVRHMRRESRQDNREQRRDDRQSRAKLNDRLKDKGLSWLERRRVIRNKRQIQRVRRKIDRKGDKAEIKQTRLREKVQRLDRRVETPFEARHGAPARPPAPASPAVRAPAPTPARPITVLRPVPGLPMRPALVVRPPQRWAPPLQSAPARPPEADIYNLPRVQVPMTPPVRAVLPPRFPLLPSVLSAPPSQPIPVLPSYGPSEEAWEAYEDAYNTFYDPIDPNGDDDGVDFNPYDTEELVNVGPNIGPGDTSELQGEIEGDLLGFLARPRFAGTTEFSGDLISGAVQGIGQAKLQQLAEIARADGWSRQEYDEAAGAIVNAVGAVGVAALATAATTLLPGLVDKVRERRREGTGLLAAIDDLREGGGNRRHDRAGERADRAEKRADRAEKRADRAGERAQDKGVLDVEDASWGPSTTSGNVLIRARAGKRAAVVELPGGFALVRTMDGNESPDAVVAQMQRVAEAARPAATVAGFAGPLVAGCGCGCGRCGGHQNQKGG